MASPDTITIGADTFDVYASVADGNTYFNGKLDREIWAAASAGTKERAIISATRLFDLEGWQGAPTDLLTPQAIAWPRTGVSDKNNSLVADSAFPADLLAGFFELAQAIIADPALDQSANQDSNIKRVTADVVNVSFFRPVAGSRFPTQVHNFISQFLDSGGSSVGGNAYGTDYESAFEERSGLIWDPFK